MKMAAAAGFRNWPGLFKALLLRAWAAGAVCFFAAWGRRGAEEVGAAYSLDLIAGLVMIMILADWIIVEPFLRLAFNFRRDAGPVRGGLRLMGGALHILRTAVIITLIVGTYYCLNVLFIGSLGLDEKAVPVPLEPILFGILYGIYFFLYTLLEGAVKIHFMPRKEAVP
jgi:hypothetical protein